MPVQFAAFTKEESAHVSHIVERAQAIARESGQASSVDPMSLRMDLAAVHFHHPLRLAELAAADKFNFTHDVFGIIRHMNRETGELGECFVPRFSSRK